MNPNPPPAKHSELPVLTISQSIGYPHPVVLRAKESADGPVKIATVHHTASYSAQEMAEQIVTACNLCDLPMIELEGILAQGGLKAVLNRLASENQAMREALNNILANAVLIPDPKMGGATDAYSVPIDDIEAIRTALALAEGKQP